MPKLQFNKKVIIFIFLFTACLIVKVGAENKKFEYLIGPEDVLRIYVWNHPELSLTVPVRIDGKISLPLVNDVDAAGVTPMELRKIITEKISKFIEQPTVSVIIEAINSQKIIIAGQVNSPGVYRVGSLITIIEALSKSGGLNEWANAKKVKVFRNENNKEKIIEVNYNQLLKGENLENNIFIIPGDKIIVP